MAPYKQFIEGQITNLSLNGWSTNKLKRVAKSSLSAEIQQACNTDDEFAARLLWSEINGCKFVFPVGTNVSSRSQSRRLCSLQ